MTTPVTLVGGLLLAVAPVAANVDSSAGATQSTAVSGLPFFDACPLPWIGGEFISGEDYGPLGWWVNRDVSCGGVSGKATGQLTKIGSSGDGRCLYHFYGVVVTPGVNGGFAIGSDDVTGNQSNCGT